MRARGRTHATPSEHRWPDWVTPPVLCAGCNSRVRIAKDSFWQSYTHGTFHATAECLPYTVKVTCGRRPLRVASVNPGDAA